MKNTFSNQTEIPAMKAGDIIVSRGKSWITPFIMFFSWSKWSHVGIALDENSILEAVKENDSSIDLPRQIRVVSVSHFLADKSKERQYIRPEKLSGDQLAKLQNFTDSKLGVGYTAMYAAFTAFLFFIKFLFIIFALATAVWLWVNTPWSVLMTSSFFIAVLVIYLIIYGEYKLLDWSYRCEWGVKATERVFRKFKTGKWLLERKQELFCSKLVLLADTAIHGQLKAHTPSEHDVQPGHVVEACEKLKWNRAEIKVRRPKSK